MKTCIICTKQLTGLQTMYCSRRCQHKSGNAKHQDYACQQKRGRTRRRELIRLAGDKCQDCGYCKNYSALTFHHLDKSKKEFTLDIRKCSNSKWESLLKELEKCILLCHNCHHERHNPETLM